MKFLTKPFSVLILLAVIIFQPGVQAQVTSISNHSAKSSVGDLSGFSIPGRIMDESVTTSRDVTEWINIGTNSSPWGSYNYPVDMFWNTSLSQTIYTAAEINHESCSVEQLVYTYKTLTTNYPNIVDTEHFRFWIANTDQSSLSEEAGFWMPLEDFTLVYEGIIVFTSGVDQEMLIELDQPFVYNGSNICIMAERVLSENSFMNHFNFQASSRDENDLRSRLYGSYDTPFDFTLPTNDPGQTGMDLPQMADVKLGINTVNEGSLSGIITNTDANPVANTLVKILGTDLETYSNVSGHYEFSYVMPETYTVTYSAFGYVIASQSIEVDGATTQDVVLQHLPEATVEGTVLDNDNNPIAGATIQISGYDSYTATSDANGLFSIPEVYYDDSYVVAVSKAGYDTEIINLEVGNAVVTMDDIHLTDKLESPSKVVAVKNDLEADITWLSPYERTVYRRDGGDLVLQIGHNYAGEVAVFGQVFREPAKLYQMSWYLDSINEPHDYVNVFVFALNEAGNPTNTVLYEQANIPNKDLQWTTFTFPDTIIAPTGFYMALSSPIRLELGIDSGLDPDYPHQDNVNWVSEDYGSNEFLLLEELGLGFIPGNLMIRAEGYNINTGRSLNAPVAPPARSLNTFTIHRLEEGQQQMPAQWVLLGENLTETSFTDELLPDAEAGYYRYAVTGVYSAGHLSPAAFSNVIENKLTAEVTFNITTNTPSNESLGAVVTLMSNDGNYAYTLTVDNENGLIVFPAVFKGFYNVMITHDRFNDFAQANVDFSLEPAYTMEVELVETLSQPFNLEINMHNDLSAQFRWNHTMDIYEDFEECADFEIEPLGVVNWKYNDVDKKNTIGIDNFTYPNENEPHSFMIFNPTQTNPPIDLDLNPTIAPHSGDKYLASFGVTHGSNDDYFISPELNFGQEFVFRFWAKSFSDVPSMNKIMVGYSNTGFQPEDFTWLTTTAIELPYDRWTRYTYEVDSAAKYVAIHNVSDGGYILMIDDVELYAKQSTRALINYQVYLNGNFMGETTDYTFDFATQDIIPDEINVAGVKSVYSSGESEMSTIEFLGVYTDAPAKLLQANMNVYPNPSNGSFTIELDGEYEVSILNTLGVTLYTRNISNQGQIKLDNIKPGLYVISAKSEEKAAFKTIVVK